jgi:hypothetical protein
MKTFASLLLASLLCTLSANAGERVNIADDDAAQDAYSSGWPEGKASGGFGAWTHKNLQGSGGDTYSGFYMATKANNPELKGAAIRDKAFGLFANGTGFEAATAYRALEKPLAVGDSFSFIFQNGEIVKKFSTDEEGSGSGIGLALRNGNQAGSTDDYNKDARFEIGFYKGKSTYQIIDGESSQDSGVSFTDGGVSVTVTLVTADTYDLEITTLADKKTTKLPGRKLGGTAGASLDSFCIFNRNGEKSDAYFNGFQISREAK